MYTVYTVKELKEILNSFPDNATIEVNGKQGVDVDIAKIDNVVCLDNYY